MLALNARFRKTPLFAFRSYKKFIFRKLLYEVKNEIRMNKLGDAKRIINITAILLS